MSNIYIAKYKSRPGASKIKAKSLALSISIHILAYILLSHLAMSRHKSETLALTIKVSDWLVAIIRVV